jgi:hypothetical protein
MIVDARTFASGSDTTGVTVGRSTATGSADGTAHVDEALAMSRNASFLAVRVWFAGHRPPTCTPRAAIGNGCTLVTVPQAGVAPAAVTLGATAIAGTTAGGTTVVPSPGASVTPGTTPSGSTVTPGATTGTSGARTTVPAP